MCCARRNMLNCLRENIYHTSYSELFFLDWAKFVLLNFSFEEFWLILFNLRIQKLLIPSIQETYNKFYIHNEKKINYKSCYMDKIRRRRNVETKRSIPSMNKVRISPLFLFIIFLTWSLGVETFVFYFLYFILCVVLID